MSPTAKFNALLASATVTVIAYGSIEAHKLQSLPSVNPVVLALAALITSAGFYRLLSIGFRWWMERWQWLNEKILGASYMHGTWVGWFDGHTGERRFMVEHFVQNLEELVITGRSFTRDKKEHGYWESEATLIDARKGRLLFTYKFDVLTKSTPLQGIHTSLFDRRSVWRPPEGYSGIAHDLNDNVRIAVHARKISTALLSWSEALLLAERTFGRPREALNKASTRP